MNLHASSLPPVKVTGAEVAFLRDWRQHRDQMLSSRKLNNIPPDLHRIVNYKVGSNFFSGVFAVKRAP